MNRRSIASKRRRNRPNKLEWQRAIENLMTAHADHGYLPQHALRLAAQSIGVAPRSLETRYRQHVRTLEETSGTPAVPEVTALRAVADFPGAYLAVGGDEGGVRYPVLERTLWRDRSRALAPLRHAERRRRQQLAETPTCPVCAQSALAAGALS